MQMLSEQEEGFQQLDLMTMITLGRFYNKDLCMTSFGDAANGMLPHIAGSMSTGFIGATKFLHDELNPCLKALDPQTSDAEISDALMDASSAYEKIHRPLAQKLLEYSIEQGTLWSSELLDLDELSKRPRFLWETA
jgi:hypothetical protein